MPGIFFGYKLFSGFQLGTDIRRNIRRQGNIIGKSGPGKFSGASGAAKDTAPVSESAIPVWTGKPAVQGNFIYFFTKMFLQILFKE